MYYTNTVFKNLLIAIEFKTTLENMFKKTVTWIIFHKTSLAQRCLGDMPVFLLLFI